MLNHKTFCEQIEEIIEAPLKDMGYDLFHIEMLKHRGQILQVMIERLDGEGVTIDDCVAASRQISALLDVEDPIRGKYTLEVGSPGIDRPLIRKKDFERFLGEQVKVESLRLIGGQKKFKGVLKSVTDENITVDLPETSATIPFEDIKKANLVGDLGNFIGNNKRKR